MVMVNAMLALKKELMSLLTSVHMDVVLETCVKILMNV
jgi:hypothetical protein